MMNTTRAITLFLWALSSMAQTLPRPAGPYFEPLPDWQYKAGIVRGIVIAPGDTIIPPDWEQWDSARRGILYDLPSQ